MRNVSIISSEILSTFPAVDEAQVDKLLAEELAELNRKIVVLDDDPTGVQTVHGISVFTNWEKDTMRQGFQEENSMFFILTNSRAFSAAQTADVHRTIISHLVEAADGDFIVISRSDSTLRGHYPLETLTIKEELERLTDKRIHGEIIIPFFKEGGRCTIDGVHYVQEGDNLIPAGMTEFAKDVSFGYQASHLGDWCAEKTAGEFDPADMVYISLESLRKLDIDAITAQLMGVEGFNKIIVNAVDYVDVKVFAIALARAMKAGKEFIIRGAAAISKVLGGVPDKPLLTKAELIPEENANGGILIVGSHVQKTTEQLKELMKSDLPIEYIEFNQHLALDEAKLKAEVKRVAELTDSKIRQGQSVAVYTKRERLDLDTDDKAQQLALSVRISEAVTSIFSQLTVRPNFIVAKGGITSSDVGTKGLKVQRATVMGQIKPGIPVWMTGSESKFPNMPYVIFPGNVGGPTTLREVLEILMK